MKQRWISVLLLTLWSLSGCGEEASDPRTLCSEQQRLVVQGRVGPSRHGVERTEPFEGQLGSTFFTAVLESGEEPHLIGFTSNTALDTDLVDAIIERLRSGPGDAGTLVVSTRPNDIPCDPREGVICASYGVDTNGDGILFGANEVIYPVQTGDIVFTQVDGNVVAANFEIAFDPLTSGQETGGDEGGTLHGCFHYYRTANRQGLR